MNWPEPSRHPAAEAAARIREVTDLRPDTAIVLGSGLGDALVARIAEEASFAFTDLPGFPPPTVPGHAGHVILGRLEGVPVAAFRGRIHFYEHHDMEWCSLTVRLARALGAETAVVTAAVGGVAPACRPGSLVIVRDHVNLMGENPLAGWRFPDGSPAFVDLSGAYDPGLAARAEAEAERLGIEATPGIYAAFRGPSFETGAEIAMLRTMGAAVVGMSMVPEVVAAHAQGMRVLGLAWVANAAGVPVHHEDVLAAGRRAAEDAGALIAAILARPT